MDLSKLKYKVRKKLDGTYNRGNRTAQTKRYTEKNKHKVEAHKIIKNLLLNGQIIKSLYCNFN